MNIYWPPYTWCFSFYLVRFWKIDLIFYKNKFLNLVLLLSFCSHPVCFLLILKFSISATIEPHTRAMEFTFWDLFFYTGTLSIGTLVCKRNIDREWWVIQRRQFLTWWFCKVHCLTVLPRILFLLFFLLTW